MPELEFILLLKQKKLQMKLLIPVTKMLSLIMLTWKRQTTSTELAAETDEEKSKTEEDKLN